ncbi:Crp/Fnr family transcriptional regulator [Sphingomonas sp. PB4P5]|uniref:Crp/Fnr family transcriptional regulator n=1 Tax=Parasphingomonas puruogangriensis TaxID=3096155 RepID=UPI002FC8C60C
MTHPLIKKLQSVGNLAEDDLDLLGDLTADVRDFGARRDIIREGEKPDHVHLMLEGWSCRYQLVPDGGKQITAFLLPGDFCDVHITMFREMDHSIGTLGAAKVAFIARELMLEMTERPGIARALWWASLVDEAVLRAWIVNFGRRDSFQRVAHLICELYARLRNVGLATEDVFDLPLTQEDLSDALGLTPVHVNRVLKRLREEGMMTFKRQQISILDVRKLQTAAGFDPSYLHLPN